MHQHNPLWPSLFEKIASQLQMDLTAANINFVSVVHIGSTSIPNLNAKPIIDILITIPPVDFFNPEILPLVIAALRDGEPLCAAVFIPCSSFGIVEQSYLSRTQVPAPCCPNVLRICA